MEVIFDKQYDKQYELHVPSSIASGWRGHLVDVNLNLKVVIYTPFERPYFLCNRGSFMRGVAVYYNLAAILTIHQSEIHCFIDNIMMTKTHIMP